jgi:hypothetical protein
MKRATKAAPLDIQGMPCFGALPPAVVYHKFPYIQKIKF